MLRNQIVTCFAGIVLGLVVAGCGGGANLPPGETGTVRGKVTYNGGPVPEHCVVTFMRSEDGLVATGVTDSSGEYLLYARGGLDIVVGTYRVAVGPPNVTQGMSDDEIMRLSIEGKLPDTSKIKEVPDRYRSPETTTIVCQVKAGPNTFDVEMKD